MTPLHIAAESANIPIVNYFFNQGADVNIQDDDGVTRCDYTYVTNDDWLANLFTVSLIQGCRQGGAG